MSQLERVLLYYITDRTHFPGSEPERRRGLLASIAAAASAGVDYVQLREKDLSARELFVMAQQAIQQIRRHPNVAKLLVNSRADVALASGADGVHLTSAPGELPASEVRTLWIKARQQPPVIAVSCHTIAEIEYAEAHGADLAVFGPVFEKDGKLYPTGLAELRRVCSRGAAPSSRMPVLALGGVTLENAAECVAAGASGIAAIRLFQQRSSDMAETVRALRQLRPGAASRRRLPYQA
jgi:thiamine-phosphate pyrophosphorylase